MTQIKNIDKVESIVNGDGVKFIIRSSKNIKQINFSNLMDNYLINFNNVSDSIDHIVSGKEEALPTPSKNNSGKFLRVSENGTWILEEGVIE